MSKLSYTRSFACVEFSNEIKEPYILTQIMNYLCNKSFEAVIKKKKIISNWFLYVS